MTPAWDWPERSDRPTFRAADTVEFVTGAS
jgi:hypothetical protein